MNLRTATPVEIDTELAEVQQAEANATERASALNQRIYFARQSGIDVTTMKIERDKFRAEQERASERVRELDGEFQRRGGWSRFYLVANTGGHVHTSTHCRTCYASTQFVWLVDQSGKSNEEVSGLAGEKSCADCFPNLPAEVMRRKTRLEDPEKAKKRLEREAAKAEKARQAEIKGIEAPEGGPLHEITDTRSGGWKVSSSVIKTEVAARNRALHDAKALISYTDEPGTGLDALGDVRTFDKGQFIRGAERVSRSSEMDGHPSAAAWREGFRRYTEALALKQRRPVESVRAELWNKAIQSEARDMAKAAKDEVARLKRTGQL